MTKSEKNRTIIRQFDDEIRNRGYEGQLACEPIPNGCKRRPKYFIRQSDQKRCFSVFLWQMNSLPDDKLDEEINYRINEAVNYFRGKELL